MEIALKIVRVANDRVLMEIIDGEDYCNEKRKGAYDLGVFAQNMTDGSEWVCYRFL